MKPLNLMVDIDDVLFPLVKGLHKKAHEMGLHDDPEGGLRVWNGHEQYGCTAEEWYAVFEALHEDGFYTSEPPIEDAATAIRTLYYEGHTINLVTARGFMARGQEIKDWTREWVTEFAIPHHALVFAKDKVGTQAALGRFDAAIDDGAHNYRALKADGVNVSLLTVPHNEDEDVDPADRVYAVSEWASNVLESARG